MMSLLGPNSEGTQVQRLLFTERNLGAFLTWLFANYPWILFFALGLLPLVIPAGFTSEGGSRIRGIITGLLQTAPFYSVLFNWIPSFWRFYGAGTNTYAMMLAFGSLPATIAEFALTFGFIALELWDLSALLGYRTGRSSHDLPVTLRQNS